jgi:hypothetical protein
VGAEKATLTFMVGGEAAALEAAQSVLASMGKSIVHCGPSGSGQVRFLSPLLRSMFQGFRFFFLSFRVLGFQAFGACS